MPSGFRERLHLAESLSGSVPPCTRRRPPLTLVRTLTASQGTLDLGNGHMGCYSGFI